MGPESVHLWELLSGPHAGMAISFIAGIVILALFCDADRPNAPACIFVTLSVLPIALLHVNLDPAAAGWCEAIVPVLAAVLTCVLYGHFKRRRELEDLDPGE